MIQNCNHLSGFVNYSNSMQCALSSLNQIFNENKDVKIVLNDMPWLAERIPAETYCVLGYRYTGRGFEKDLKKSLYYYQLAAEQGHAPAQWKMGHIYENGQGVAKDYQKAVEYYQKAADKGHRFSQFILGQYYEVGMGVEPNMRIANKWYQRAAAQGDHSAQDKIGNSWERLMDRYFFLPICSHFSPLIFAAEDFFYNIDSSSLQQKIEAPVRLYNHPIEELKRKGQLILKKLNTMQNIFKRLTSRARCDVEKDFLEVVSNYAVAGHAGAVEFLTEYEQNIQPTVKI